MNKSDELAQHGHMLQMRGHVLQSLAGLTSFVETQWDGEKFDLAWEIESAVRTIDDFETTNLAHLLLGAY